MKLSYHVVRKTSVPITRPLAGIFKGGESFHGKRAEERGSVPFWRGNEPYGTQRICGNEVVCRLH